MSPVALGKPQQRSLMPDNAGLRSPCPNYPRLFLLFFAGLADCFLLLAYCPALADSLESLVLAQPSSASPPLSEPIPGTGGVWPGVVHPPVLSADKAPVDDNTPVIGVSASGKSRAYLLEALERGPRSHVVNDVLGNVPISVTHCDISGCTRVFTGAVPGRPLELSVGGLKDSRLVLRFGGHIYCQNTSESFDEKGTILPCSEYPAKMAAWKDWRKEHPDTDIYMGPID